MTLKHTETVPSDVQTCVLLPQDTKLRKASNTKTKSKSNHFCLSVLPLETRMGTLGERERFWERLGGVSIRGMAREKTRLSGGIATGAGSDVTY